MNATNLSMPWAHAGQHQYSSPSSLLLKVRLGEAPDNAPTMHDVTQRVHGPICHLDHGPIDRIVCAMAGGLRAARLHSSAANATNPGRRHIGFDETEHVTGLARTFLMRVAPGTPISQLCDSLSQLATVETVSPNYLCSVPFDQVGAVNAAGMTSDWGSREMVNADKAHTYEVGDSAVLIGLVDSGIAVGHGEFDGVFRAGYDTVWLRPHDVAPGVNLLGDYLRDDADPTDDFVGHGMACAGIIAAKGIRMPAGLGGAARVIPLRALGAALLPDRDQAVGLGAIADLDVATKLCVDLGAKVINMSFGTDERALPPSSPRPHADVVDYALARGCVLVAASGNNGVHTRYWPAAHPGVIAVGAVSESGEPAVFSTRGKHVALCAPGQGVLTAAIQGYQLATGTSFAAPFVSAAAALLVAHAARRATPLNGSDVREILIRSAQPFRGTSHPVDCGVGILDAAAALEHLQGRLDQAAQLPGTSYEH